jgi:hypothetical protein
MVVFFRVTLVDAFPRTLVGSDRSVTEFFITGLVFVGVALDADAR